MRQAKRITSSERSWWLDMVLISLILGGLFFILAGSRPLFVPDEGRYAEIAREMVSSGNYLTPHLDGIKYFEKPVFFYWLGALAFKLGGIHVWSIRCVNAFLGLFGCLLTYFTTRTLYNRTTGLLAAFLLGTSLLFFIMTHMVSLDLPVTIFLAATLYFFLLGCHEPPSYKRRAYLYAASIAAALAVLTKGLIGLVFPMMVIGCWIALLNEWRLLMRIYLPSCLFIFFLIAAPWHILVAEHNPEFFYFYFIEQHFLRYMEPYVGHYQPSWFFIPCLFLGFFPWSVFLPQALAAHLSDVMRKRSDHKIELFFLLWATLIFLFFSFSKSKLIPYILPIFPALAVITAHYLANVSKHKKGLKIGFSALVMVSALMLIGIHTYLPHANVPHPLLATYYLTLALSILTAGALMGYLYCLTKFRYALSLTLFSTLIFLLLTIASIPALDGRTILPLATKISTLLKDHEEVITYDQYYQDLPFYLQQRVTIVNWQNELSFGMQHQDTHAWMINDDDFWQRFKGKKRVFVITSKDEYEKLKIKHPKTAFFNLGSTLNNVLLSNQSSEDGQ